MDFLLIEKDMYGDVENDDELMAELLALEAEERAVGHIPPEPVNLKHECSARENTKGFSENFVIIFRKRESEVKLRNSLEKKFISILRFSRINSSCTNFATIKWFLWHFKCIGCIR